MTAVDVRAAIATTLERHLADVAVHDRMPLALSFTPAVVVVRESYQPYTVMGPAGGSGSWRLLVVDDMADSSNLETIEALVDEIIACFEADDDLDGRVGSAMVTRVGDEDTVVAFGDVRYFATPVTVEVAA